MDLQQTSLLNVTHLLNGLIMVALPVGLGILLTRKFKQNGSLWWIGAGTFILSQVGHIPFNAALTRLFERGILPAPPQAWSLVVNAVILGLSAGLWEELTRFATYRWWAKDARSWRKGILVGAGHGGIEAIILGLLVLVTFISMLSLRNADLATIVPIESLERAQAQVAAYWGAAWYDSLLGAVERLFTLPVQIALSILVLQVFTHRRMRWLWLGLAVGWHALVDAATVYTLVRHGAYFAEVVVGISSLLSLGMIAALRSPEPVPSTQLAETPMLVTNQPAVIQPVEETTENLEKTRYN